MMKFNKMKKKSKKKKKKGRKLNPKEQALAKLTGKM